MDPQTPNPSTAHWPTGHRQETRDIAEVPAIEVITTAAVHLMSAAAVKCGLARGAGRARPPRPGRGTPADQRPRRPGHGRGPDLGSQHAAPLRDGLKSLQLAFREASVIPDPPGQGPGEKLTGSVV